MDDVTSKAQLVEFVNKIPSADGHSRRIADERQQILTKPPGSLGRLEEIALWLCAWQGTPRPRLDHCQALVFAGNHGIAARGVSAYPADVTAQMVANFEAGGAAINQLCAITGVTLDVHALDLDRPTGDFSIEPAMSEGDCLKAVNKGMNSVDPDAHIVLLGEMGIGNTTVASALCCGLFGDDPASWVGRGTGVNDRTVALKAEFIRSAITRHRTTLSDPLAILATLGGREQAAIFGAALGARLQRIPVILDGFVCTAAASPLEAMMPGALDHCLVGHVSAESGHRRLLDNLGKKALLDLDMRLGEASGAAVALGVVRSALAAHNGMATFTEAGVDDGDL